MSAFTLTAGILLSFLATAIPTALWAAMVWWCDRHEREPAPLLVASFLWGAFPAVLVALALELLLGVSTGIEQSQHLIGQVVATSAFAPVIEEVAKGAALLLILLFWRHEFDGVMDGLLYGALIGFGFAMTENLFYFIGALDEGGWGAWGVTVLLRSAVFGLNHAFFTAFTGAGLGYALVASWRWARLGAPLLGLIAAILAHASHNLGTSLASASPAAILLSLGSDAGGVALAILLIVLALRQERLWLQEELAPEVGRLLTPAEYERLTTQRGRTRMLAEAGQAGGWQAMRAARQLQQSLTELAFLKHRLRVRGLDPRLAQRREALERALLARGISFA